MSNMLEALSDFIFISKYARYNTSASRRETWEEAVYRTRDMHLKKFKHLNKEHKNKIIWAFEKVKEKLVVPSMRSLQFGGLPIEVKNPRLYNCLSQETEFVTDKGVKSFMDFSDGETIRVLGHSGKWRRAVVRNFGKGMLHPITISKGNTNKTIIWATKDHRWMLNDGTIQEGLQGKEILRGSENIFSKFDWDKAPIEEKLYWAYGFVYGDGTIVDPGKGNQKYSMLRLCGKDAKLVDRFEMLGFRSSSSLSLKGDIMVYTGKYLKTAPNPEKDSPELIRAFVAGYLHADGEKAKSNSPNSYLTIQSSDINHIDFIRKCFPIAGSFLISETNLTGQETNFGIRPYTIKFRVTNYFSTIGFHPGSNFRVEEIDYTQSRIEDVWCLEVEEDQTFTLPNGLITGNCAAGHIDSIRSFSEAFYLLLCGCGVTFGLSKFFLHRLPDLVDESDKSGIVLTYQVEDTIEGWADSLEALLNCYFKNTAYSGRKIIFDYSKIRKAGAPLKTSGGKAPGYKGLKNAHTQIKKILDHIIENKKLKRLRPIDAYDILMHTADAVLSGGIRRSATAVIFDKDDEEMINAKTNFVVDKKGVFEKSGEIYEGYVIVDGMKYLVELKEYEYKILMSDKTIPWYVIHPQRKRSNNSVLLLRESATLEELQYFITRSRQWGEPGFVFANHPWTLFNPCFEIGFIPVTEDGRCGFQFCNLTSQNGAEIDSIEKWKYAIEAATIIGTLQATYTDFKYLSNTSKELTDNEALLGVSLTGWLDNPQLLLDKDLQQNLAEFAVAVNQEWAEILGIRPASRVTCVKPEGTSSKVLKAGSGVHAWHARKYFNRVQVNKLDPVYRYFKKHNPHMCEPSVHSINQTDDVITWPITIPDHSMIKDEVDALKHLRMIKNIQRNWVIPGTTKFNEKDITHNVSCTVIVKDDEWDMVANYLFKFRHYFSAVSLLSYFGDKMFQQAPNEKVLEEDQERFKQLEDNFVPVDYSQLLEEEDTTQVQETLACAGGQCEI